MKKSLIIFLTFFMLLSLVSCTFPFSKGHESESDIKDTNADILNKEELLESAQKISLSKVVSDTITNIARAKASYEGNNYLIWGFTKEIGEDYVNIYDPANDEITGYIRVYLPQEELIKIDPDIGIQVVGCMSFETEEEFGYKYTNTILKNAYLINDTSTSYEIKNGIVVEKIDNMKGSYNCLVSDPELGYVWVVVPRDKVKTLDDFGYTSTNGDYVLSAKGRVYLKKMYYDNRDPYMEASDIQVKYR